MSSQSQISATISEVRYEFVNRVAFTLSQHSCEPSCQKEVAG